MTNYATQRVTLLADDVSTKQFLGREHVVAPATLVREMVLKGEFLPADEIEATQLAWNAKPSTITHPRDDDGNFIPASAPDQHETHVTGRLFDIEASNGELVGNVYIDRQRSAEIAEAMDQSDPAEMLLDGETVEGSVGYWYERFDAEGSHDGDTFDAVQVNIQPDHYALLPDDKGECSVDDGCGVGRDDATGVNSARAAWQTVKESVVAPSFGATCECDNMSRIKKLAEQTEFDEETLQDWDDSQLDSLESTLDSVDSSANDKEENSEETNDKELADNIADQVMDQVDERFEQFKKEQTEDDRQEAVAQISRHTSKDSEDLEDWSLQQLEAFAEEVTPENGIYAGRSGADTSDGSDFQFGLNGRHLEGEN